MASGPFVDSRVVRLDDEAFDDSIEELLSVVGDIGRRHHGLAGEHSVRLGRGMMWSPPVVLMLGGGETATLAYTITASARRRSA